MLIDPDTGKQISLCEYNRRQICEIDRYKWIESEKAGADLGDGCVLQWIREHSASFRSHYQG